MQTKALSIATAVSIICAFYLFFTPPSLEESAEVLQQFSNKLGKATKDHPISAEDEAKIRQLANKSILIPKLAKANVVSVAGINFVSDKKNVKPVVLSALTGNEIPSCGTISFNSQSEEGYNLTKNEKICAEILSLENNDVRIAMGINNAVKGEIKIGNEVKDAIFVVTTNIFYKGSDCKTIYINGEARLECDPPRPSR